MDTFWRGPNVERNTGLNRYPKSGPANRITEVKTNSHSYWFMGTRKMLKYVTSDRSLIAHQSLRDSCDTAFSHGISRGIHSSGVTFLLIVLSSKPVMVRFTEIIVVESLKRSLSFSDSLYTSGKLLRKSWTPSLTTSRGLFL